MPPSQFASILLAPPRGGFTRTTSNRLYAAPGAVIPRADAQVLLAAPAERPLRDAERPADFGNVQKGLILEQTANQITLMNAKNEKTTIVRNQIESMQESAVSLMPENLLKALKPEEVRDLFAYLQR